MCFNRDHKNNDYVGDYGPLPKTANNQKGFDGGSILDDIWSVAKSGFERVASLELGLYEKERLQELRATEERAKLDKTRSYSSNESWQRRDADGKGNKDTSKTLMYIAAGGLAAVALVFIAREI